MICACQKELRETGEGREGGQRGKRLKGGDGLGVSCRIPRGSSQVGGARRGETEISEQKVDQEKGRNVNPQKERKGR